MLQQRPGQPVKEFETAYKNAWTAINPEFKELGWKMFPCKLQSSIYSDVMDNAREKPKSIEDVAEIARAKEVQREVPKMSLQTARATLAEEVKSGDSKVTRGTKDDRRGATRHNPHKRPRTDARSYHCKKRQRPWVADTEAK